MEGLEYRGGGRATYPPGASQARLPTAEKEDGGPELHGEAPGSILI